jgi:hypothetical protein
MAVQRPCEIEGGNLFAFEQVDVSTEREGRRMMPKCTAQLHEVGSVGKLN